MSTDDLERDLLSSGTIESFLRRFSFHDGRIESLNIEYYVTDHGYIRINLLLSAREIMGDDERWVKMNLLFEHVIEYRLIDKEWINGIFDMEPQVACVGDLVYVDFQPTLFQWESLDDFQRSPYMVVARRCTWAVVGTD
jgi:hypothetical protein